MLQVENEKELKMRLAALDLTVPPRSEGRTKEQTERYAAAHLLATLQSQRLSFPLKLEHRDRPDFLLSMGKDSIGVEHTEAVPQNEAHASVLRATCHGPDVHFIHRSVPGEPKIRAKQLLSMIQTNEPGDGWVGDSAEREWAEAMAHCANEKLVKTRAPGFQKFNKNWLMIYDNWPLPHIDTSKAAAFLAGLLSVSDSLTVFDCIFVISDQKLFEFSRGEILTLDIVNPS